MGSQAESTLPRVAIVGRPNVGKSTLFNRLVGKRRAITHATPGVTRDPVESRVTLGEQHFMLVDTGGYTTDADELARFISGKAVDALENAALILFLIDATEITALDQEFLQLLRPHADRMILVANKIDTPERENLVWDLYSFGIPTVIGISSAHGRGIEQLLTQVSDLLPPAEASEAAPEPTHCRIAVLGQPNSGKSTLVNHLTGSDRSLVSPVPGTTRDVIEGTFSWKDRLFQIVDTAGIRRKNKVSDDIEYYSVTRAIDTIELSDVVVLLIDAEKGLTDQDKKIAQLVVNRGRGLILALNKWDLLPQVANQFQAVSDRIRFHFPVVSFAPIVALSAREGSGVNDLMKEVGLIHDQLGRRVDTARLNRHLRSWVESTPPAVSGHRGRPKLLYMTQVSSAPPHFVCFASRKKSISESYVRYLTNQLRADFGLSKIPIRLELRER